MKTVTQDQVARLEEIKMRAELARARGIKNFILDDIYHI